ncbi:MAG: hypothetical protein J2O48_10305 [Solirubrobacterales bacterium]|nr:hypothetical protein [Solirubrobacterales bacterium]
MKARVTISIDEELLAEIQQAVEAGAARSVSDWFSMIAKMQVRQESLADVMADILEETGGPPTEEEKAWAMNALGLSPSPTAAH